MLLRKLCALFCVAMLSFAVVGCDEGAMDDGADNISDAADDAADATADTVDDLGDTAEDVTEN